MRVTEILAWAASLLAGAREVQAACSGPLVIDNFSKWSSNSNSLNSWTSGKLCRMHCLPIHH